MTLPGRAIIQVLRNVHSFRGAGQGSKRGRKAIEALGLDAPVRYAEFIALLPVLMRTCGPPLWGLSLV